MSNTPNNQQQMNLQIRYEDMTGRYANQVMLNTTAEECYLDFSSAVIVDRATGGAVMPIHTRIVMNPNGMLRMYQLIGQALQNYQITQTQPAPAPENPQPVESPEGQSSESQS
ncbi:MAG: DUF3467 domain-containing protein [Chthoniobacteraceae bacterium]